MQTGTTTDTSSNSNGAMEREVPTASPSHILDPSTEIISATEPVDSCTLIDPSYVIHLIRQLLPEYTKDNHISCKDNTSALSHSSIAKVPNDQLINHDSCFNGRFKKAEDSDHQECNERKMSEEHCFNILEEDVNDFNVKEKCNSEKHVIDDTSNEYCEETRQMLHESAKEEAGCVLWDLASDAAHAEFMVKYHILDVLHATLGVCPTDRLREICIGILGNLACHEVTARAIILKNKMAETIMQQLFLDDSPCLCETCRLLCAGLHSKEAVRWAELLQPEEVLQRITWIASNTMNSQLLEKSTELLLAMVDCDEAARMLIPPLMDLGLPELILDLMTSEINSIGEGTSSHGDKIIDTILQIGEAISLAEGYSSKLASNEKLFELVCCVIKFSRKDEVCSARITATVLIANLLAEEGDLIDKILYDAKFLENLLELLPDVYDDPGARNALWSVLNRMFDGLSASDKPKLVEENYILVLAAQSSLIAEDLVEHQNEDIVHEGFSHSSEHAECIWKKESSAKMATVGQIINILGQFAGCNSSVKEALQCLRSITDSVSLHSTKH
eukprot:TRINITY_DN10664_c0_g1_i1.p1 TRINITY_DN10664_c0_g1~~TRINITY_DN10664_c0_g1_i1.p1  ORF type:complete len:561 (-),score=118.79 TRINITY_DN10664_c0_g1_i1:63-1745(-)